MSTLASSATFTISGTTSDSPSTLPFYILLITSLTMSSSIKRGTPLTISTRDTLLLPHAKLCVQKHLLVTFPSYFLIFITDCQYIISYAPLTNILVRFDHLLCNLKRTTFLSSCRITFSNLLLTKIAKIL